jgi:predicted RNA-binding Zn-ribbon protein involved in translation (DUF1610 family)
LKNREAVEWCQRIRRRLTKKVLKERGMPLECPECGGEMKPCQNIKLGSPYICTECEKIVNRKTRNWFARDKKGNYIHEVPKRKRKNK